MSEEYDKLKIELDAFIHQGSYNYMDVNELEELEFNFEYALLKVKQLLHERSKL